ncbi:hypothetical protein Chor_008412 [Crotalus horridus]
MMGAGVQLRFRAVFTLCGSLQGDAAYPVHMITLGAPVGNFGAGTQPHGCPERHRLRRWEKSPPASTARILYYAQEKYFNHVIQATNIELSKHAHDPVLLFFKGLGTLFLGRIQEGISLLENAQKRHVDVSLCCLLGLIYAHKRCENVDSSAVLDLETKLKEARKTAGSNALYYAGLFLWLMNKNDKAKEYIDKMLKVSNGAKEGQVLKGWIYVTSDKQHSVKKSIKYLEEGIQDNTDIFGMMGKAKYFMVHQNYSGALEIISQLVVTFPFFVPALVTKMKLHLAMQDWEQSVEESKRILSKEPNDIDGLQYMVVNHLAVTGNKSMALRLLREFIVALDMKEPQRPEFHFQKMLVITRLVLAYLQAVIASRKNKTEQIAGAFLNEAAELHFSALHGLPLSIEYYEKLNPMFLIEIVKEYLVFCPKQPRLPGQVLSPLLKQTTIILNPLVKSAPGIIEPLFLMAQVKYLSGELETAQGTLQRCLDLDPTLTDANLLMAQIHLSQRNIKECAHSLEIGVSYNFQHEATKIMQDAINEFSGTSEEIRVTVANVDLALSKGEVDLALTMLRNITPNQPYYTEPEKALEVYEAAQKKNPLDATVARKIGQAYVYTHQYNKAINYYEVALKMSEQDFLCHNLADLLLKLKKFGKAEKVLSQALDHDPVDDLPSMMKDVKNLILLAKIYETIKREIFLETLTKAYDIQQRILKRVRVEQPELIPPQKQMLLKICVQFAKFHQSEKEYEKAVKYYSEALACVPTDNKIIFELAELYLILGDTDQCEHYCSLLLQDNECSEIGTMMLANLMFRKEKYEQAISLYRNVLEKTPDNFSVMESLIDLLRRSGKLDEATPFFELAKKKSIRTPLEPGYNYCMGLYCWHLWQPNQALKFFNKARKDSDWGQKALSYMILICLNPDNEIVGGETFENQNTTDASNLKEKKESEQHGIRTAEKLLKEFYPHSQEGQNQVEMLQSYCLMATKEKHNVEKALKVFIEMGQNERDNVPAILAMAQAYMLLKHTAKARTQLKRLIKVSWSLPDADELEKAWLLLSDIYCTSGKYDLATEHVKRCLRYNKSCAKAYECLGFIAEKENAYKDATMNYELAWKYSNQANPAVGFKLAFNYLKDKKYVEAIDVCHDVLKAYPDYPKIKEEILEKAQMSFKP